MSNSNHKIILFSEVDFKGKALVVFDKIDNFYLKLYEWNDRAKSLIVVKGKWTLQGELNGKEHTSSVVEGSEYKNLQDLPGAWRSISIVTPV
jgi:hypothetical protein